MIKFNPNLVNYPTDVYISRGKAGWIYEIPDDPTKVLKVI